MQKMPKVGNTVQVKHHASATWRQAVVKETRGHSLLVDINGTQDWVCSQTHEILVK